ncbi:DNA-3-methyladenine glycosylase isoform X1 [Gadus morhua]|uniref:DNA-3-methyladenine glycosylase II n=2 Tax=Gadus morhua TaxID=8049 RepID=A0A8C5AI24_GADMO|nr:DNA-3-methyladenine glycosylase isoform X1 [Gadus morhua]
MEGRKRKMLSAASSPKRTDTKNNIQVPSSHLNSITCENNEATSRKERSRYFKGDRNESRLGENFFNQPCIALAKALLGKVLVRRCADGSELRGRVVETEAYLGGEDKASHSAGGKRTERNTACFMKPGTIYVYSIYGMYLCMNVSSQGEGAAVLLRSLEPLQGQPVMRQLRAQARRKATARPLKEKELCNGPAKLCQALDIPRLFDRRDLARDPDVWLETESDDPGFKGTKTAEAGDRGAVVVVVAASRVGIESHGEWAKKPWRFYLLGNHCVSVVDRAAERLALDGGHDE